MEDRDQGEGDGFGAELENLLVVCPNGLRAGAALRSAVFKISPTLGRAAQYPPSMYLGK